MANSDRTVFLSSLKLWENGTPGTEVAALLKPEENLDRLVDEMFDQFCDLQMDPCNSFVGNC